MAFTALLWSILLVSVDATWVYVIQENQCGESDVPDFAVVFAQATTPGLTIGRCSDEGYTQPVGSTSVDAGLLGTIETNLYAMSDASMCSAEQIAALTAACNQYDSTTADGICGSECQAQAEEMEMGVQTCDVTGDITEMLYQVIAHCNGDQHVGDWTCSDGLYFEAYQPSDEEFGFASLEDVEIDSWEPVVEHAEHGASINYVNDNSFVEEIEGFSATDRFVMRWRGNMMVDTPGEYQFSTVSDDGSILWIDEEIVVNNDGLHGPQTATGSLRLQPGSHAIKILFFENQGGAHMEAMWSPTPGADLQHIGGAAFTNTIGCGDDTSEFSGAGGPCAIGYCEDVSNCPQCDRGLQCLDDGAPCAGFQCFGTCAAIGPAACHTCAELDWPVSAHNENVCGESDDNFACQTGAVQAEAEETCMAAGARICTADELLAGAGTNTGCGHNARMIWSGSDSITYLGETISCNWNERIVVSGSPHNSLDDVACTNVADDHISTRCCADTTCNSDAPQDMNIIELGSSQPEFSTLISAIETAGLSETLSGPGPFTVFAPTNAAFEALGDALTSVLQDHEMLTSVLTYHVASGIVLSTDLESGVKLQTVEGDFIGVRFNDDGTVYVDGGGVQAMITQADITASNGVVHVIDAVLMPPGH